MSFVAHDFSQLLFFLLFLVTSVCGFGCKNRLFRSKVGTECSGLGTKKAQVGTFQRQLGTHECCHTGDCCLFVPSVPTFFNLI